MQSNRDKNRDLANKSDQDNARENFGDTGTSASGPRGFAAMDEKQQREIASKGGSAPHSSRGRQKGYKAGDDAGFVVGPDVAPEEDKEYVPAADIDKLPVGEGIGKDSLRSAGDAKL